MNMQIKLVFNIGLKPCVEDWACAYVKGLLHQTVSPLYMADVGI